MKRPGRGMLATSRWDVAPPFRSLWQNLIGLYVPMTGDGRKVPNRAPSSLPALYYEGSDTPPYDANGAVFNGSTGQSYRANIPAWMLPVIRSTRLAVMWSGQRTGTPSQNSGLFGLNAHAAIAPWHTVGFQWRGEHPRYDFVSQYSDNDAYDSRASVLADTPKSVAVATRTATQIRSLIDGPDFSFFDASFGYGYSMAATTIEVYAGNRYSGEVMDQRQVWSIGAIWNKSLTDHEMLQLDRDPWALCARWKRSFAGVNFRTLRPVGLDVVNTGWTAL